MCHNILRDSIVVLTPYEYVAHAQSQDELLNNLRNLKKICDEDLLTEEECTQERQRILQKYRNTNDEEWFCNYGGESKAPQRFADSVQGNSFSQSASASEIVKEILDEAGMAPNFIVRPALVPNAAASARGEERYIEYNPSFVAQLQSATGTNWAVYSVMAHEIGHHVQGHTIRRGGSRPGLELEADDYSGFILAKLGATLGDAQTAMRTLGSDSSTGTHPPSEQRLQAIKNGWNKGLKRRGPDPVSDLRPRQTETAQPPLISREQPLPVPRTLTYTETCSVSDDVVLITSDGAVVSRFRGYMQVGQKTATAFPRLCAFDIVTQMGRYCVVNAGGWIYPIGEQQPVGQCLPCSNPYNCN